MDKAILNEEENLFQKIIKLFPKNNNSSEKKDKFLHKHLLPPNKMKCQIIKKINNKSDSPSLNDNLSINSDIKETKFINNANIQTKSDILNNDKISCQIPLKEEENNSISSYSKKNNKKQKSEKDKNVENKFLWEKKKKIKI